MDELQHLVSQLRPSAYLAKTNDWIRGSLPRSSFRIGSPSSERPGPQVDRTDRDVLAERHRWRVHYWAVAYWVNHNDPGRAAQAAVKALHIEHVALDEKPGDRDLGGWPCRNYGKLIYGRHCMTDNHDHPDAECAACRKAKSRQAETQSGGTAVAGGAGPLYDR